MPEGTQFFQASGGEWHQPFLLTLAQHPHHHAAAVDLRGGQVQGFADPQPGGVDGPQCHLDGPVAHGIMEEKAMDLVVAQLLWGLVEVACQLADVVDVRIRNLLTVACGLFRARFGW